MRIIFLFLGFICLATYFYFIYKTGISYSSILTIATIFIILSFIKELSKYVKEINIKEGECYNKIDEFLQEHPITENKKPSTLQRYEREIRKFTEYIYQMETWTLPSKEEDKQDITDKHSKHKTMSNTGNESTNTNEIDEEYKAFLEKYEQITRKYG